MLDVLGIECIKKMLTLIEDAEEMYGGVDASIFTAKFIDFKQEKSINLYKNRVEGLHIIVYEELGSR